MNTRPRSLGLRDRPKMSWITPWPGPVGRVRLAGEDDLDRALLVPQQAGQPVEVAEQRARRACRSRTAARSRSSGCRGSRTSSSSSSVDGASPWRANWLRSRPRAKIASSSFWRWCASHSSTVGICDDALPEPALVGLLVHGVEVGVRVALEHVAHRLADPGRRVDAVGEPEDLGRGDRVPGRVGGLAVELRDGVGAVGQPERERGHVELARVALHAEAELEQLGRAARRRCRVDRRRRTAGRRPGGRGPRRTARCRPRPGCGS